MEQLPLPGTMSSAKPSRRHSIAVALRQNIVECRAVSDCCVQAAVSVGAEQQRAGGEGRGGEAGQHPGQPRAAQQEPQVRTFLQATEINSVQVQKSEPGLI